ncbi:MAG TPA: Flp pilus assembly protein CpaB [Clostridiales bacterium]|nr:MAG: SAF domain protein [Firmicutes bacterium ADurb.Bin262]HOU11010.1 Flp pilus assembly protein CpaB [Clostridiales bacterium]HQH62426.1 Flp pilus assembly protein CpaB [Clostridiales bacterium]HQK74093.1 Flp pilus assembly protein CpaB [Clostridiales bacterium]
MMKKVYLIATVVAIITGIATYLFASQLQKNSTIKDTPNSPIVVAKVNIPKNTIVTADMVELKQLPTLSVTPGAYSNPTDVVGKVARQDIMLGEQLVPLRFVQPGRKDNNAALSNQLKEGEYAYTLSVDVQTGVAGYISEGDYVDVMYLKTSPDGKTTADIVFQNIFVIRTSGFSENYSAESAGTPILEYSNVTLVLTLEQCRQMALYQSTGMVRLLLKPVTAAAQQPGETTTAPETTTAATP